MYCEGGIYLNKVILKSLSAENYATFADKVFFTTELASSKKDTPAGIFSEGDYSFNKVSFVYGANGSGKTFFCKIIKEIQRIIDWSPLTRANAQFLSLPQLKGIDAPVKTFAFDSSYSEKPSIFSIEIMIDGIVYFYEFSIFNKKIVSEILTKKYRRTETILKRTSPSYKDITLRSELKDFEATKHTVNEEALCLPMAAMLNNVFAQKIISAIQDIQVINMATARLAPAGNENAFSDERILKYVKILEKADPTIHNLKVSYSEEEVDRKKIKDDDFESREIIMKQMSVGIESEHSVLTDNQEVICSAINFFADESLGTVKLFTALPYIFDTLESGGIIVVDEIENGLHLSLVKEIIGLFKSEITNPHNAQLVCTSHQPLLVDGDFRRDQVWIAKKDSLGKSTLLRASDYKTPHAKTNISKRILEDAFGCNPDNFFKNNI